MLPFEYARMNDARENDVRLRMFFGPLHAGYVGSSGDDGVWWKKHGSGNALRTPVPA
jgi:hypothetical protein